MENLPDSAVVEHIVMRIGCGGQHIADAIDIAKAITTDYGHSNAAISELASLGGPARKNDERDFHKWAQTEHTRNLCRVA